MEGENKSICGTWRLEGKAAELVIEHQNEMKVVSPVYRGTFGKQRTIQALLCELYDLRKNKKCA